MKALFIGNSHTYFNDMPHLMALMCKKCADVLVDVTMLAYSGRTLQWHTKEYFSLRFNLSYGGYDYCIIQQAAHPFPPEEETVPYAKEIIKLCREVGTIPVLYLPWAEKTKPENQRRLTETYEKLAAETGALLAPVGRIWQSVQAQRPDIALYWHDGEHASPYGDYLAAATFCALLTGGDLSRLDSTGLDFTRNREIDFAHPQALAAKDTLCQLEDDACLVIRQAISAFLQKRPQA